VLQNAQYYKFANENAVDVLAMEEMDRAEQEKNPLAETVRAKDEYGDEQEYLVEFAGLTREQLRELSTSSGALQYLHGTRIPFTAIVDPHTGEEMFAWTGVKTAKEYVAIIAEQGKALVAKHGKGVDRALWNELRRGEVKLDRLLGDGKVAEACRVFAKLAARAERPPEAVETRLEAMRAMLEREAKKALAAAKPGRELEELTRALEEAGLAK
jgi:hypothetical protein